MFFYHIIMSDNPSFVLQGVGQVSFEDRPIPESTVVSLYVIPLWRFQIYTLTVGEDEVLVQVKKTGGLRVRASLR